jgi:hypothetical protein
MATVACWEDCEDGVVEYDDGLDTCPRCHGTGAERCYDCWDELAVMLVRPIDGDVLKPVAEFPVRVMPPGIALCAACVAGRRAEGLPVEPVG